MSRSLSTVRRPIYPFQTGGFGRGNKLEKLPSKSLYRLGFPGVLDRVGGSSRHYHYYGCDWTGVPVPPVPIFDEEMSSVEERARGLVGKVRCHRKFEPAHPLIAKLLLMTRSVGKNFLNIGRVISPRSTTPD